MLVQAVEARFKESIRQVCQEDQVEIEALEVMPDHVQRHGHCRSAIWHASTGQVDQRTSLKAFAQGISSAQAQIADALDESYFCVTTAGAPLSVIKHYIEQQKHVSHITEKGNKAEENLSFSSLSDAQANMHAGNMARLVLRSVQCGAR